ncbi:hypothetical protein [Desertibacillus haloalkaliphilus]|uniref:hypothetical protein n=1 Tax=Desertibacillus haloalkaliphilus TaxID=1328930 RepID=UPI001C270DDC|nr:hypothetical protein [Desertibacillus haloalkaliphilus]MBU8908316.1 hypothetical protein [Desertibacillus haloalkaliphilus]
MLEVKITSTDYVNIENFLNQSQFRLQNGIYKRSLEEKIDLMVQFNKQEKAVYFTFPGDLSLDHFDLVHETIQSFIMEVKVDKIDEANAFIGYLSDGSHAYILSGWKEWVHFISGAKHNSMEGQKVEVSENDNKIAEGILLDYDYVLDKKNFIVKKCTLLTLFGEKEYTGHHLIIRATGEFV